MPGGVLTLRRTLAVLAVVSLLLLPASLALARDNASLDYPFDKGDLRSIARTAANWALLIIVITATIWVAIGAYFYLAASGNAALAQQGKEIITRALFGLVIALIAFVLLKTISPQFVGGGPAGP